MKDSKETEHRISNLKDMMQGIKENKSEDIAENSDNVEEEYEIVDADEMIHELSDEEEDSENRIYEIDDEFIYTPNQDSDDAEILKDIDENFIIETRLDDSKIDDETYIDNKEDTIFDDDQISEQFNNVVHARVGKYPVMGFVSLAAGILLLIISSIMLLTQSSQRVVDSVASGELNVIVVAIIFVGIILLIIGIYKLFSLKNPFGDLSQKITDIEKEEKKEKKEIKTQQPTNTIPKSKIPLNKDDYKIGEFDISSFKNNLNKPKSNLDGINVMESELKPTFKKDTSIDTEIKKESEPKKEIKKEEKITEKDEPAKEEKSEAKAEDEEYEKTHLDNETIDDIFASVEEIEDIPIISLDSKDENSSDKKEE